MRNESEFMDEIDLLEVAGWLLEKIWLILAACALAGAVTFAGIKLFVAPTYEATAMLIVNTRQDANATVTSDQINSAVKLVDTYGIIIRSRTVLEPVIGSLNLDMDYEALYNAVEVKAVGSTQVLRVVVKNHSAEVAQQICATIIAKAPEAIVDAVEAGSVKVVEKAVADPDPVAPRALRTAGIAAMAVGVLLCAIIVMIHLLDNKIKSEDDVEEILGWPVLGVIPSYVAGKPERRPERQVERKVERSGKKNENNPEN